MKTRRLTAAQALVQFLLNQYVERDGKEHKFFAGCFGIFGHGNLAGIGQALQQYPEFTYYQCRNEQAMVHTAAAYARAKNRLSTFALTSSVGPGATNMVTGAALATINRLPVLIIPGDIFARRNVAPVLQQLESEHSQDISVNDCFKPVSRYWDRINRPEQLLTSVPEAMRVLTSPSETGAVTLAFPQDVQAEAYEYPESFFEKRVWTVPRQRADLELLERAANLIKESKQPLIIAGGGVIYSEATDVLARLSESTGIPAAETQAGKGSLHYKHRLALGALGVTGTAGANILAREADLVIGIGTRYSDFTTASKTAFQNERVHFININVSDFDAHKHNALSVVADARATLEELSHLLIDYQTSDSYQKRAEKLAEEWDQEVERIYKDGDPNGTISQGEAIGVINSLTDDKDVVVCAAGSMPGDLHKLWRTRDAKGYHVEYGYSCMGYEIAGGLGIKMAQPEREVYVFVGDGSYLMMAQEIATAVQEGIKINIVLIDNHGYASIGGLSRSLGSEGFGTSYRYRAADGQLSGDFLPVDLAANAESLGATVLTANTRKELEEAVKTMKSSKTTVVVVVETDTTRKVGGYESWWDVPVAEVSTMSAVRSARTKYEEKLPLENSYYSPADKGAKSPAQKKKEVAKR